jgi:hypothetical protein
MWSLSTAAAIVTVIFRGAGARAAGGKACTWVVLAIETCSAHQDYSSARPLSMAQPSLSRHAARVLRVPQGRSRGVITGVSSRSSGICCRAFSSIRQMPRIRDTGAEQQVRRCR